MFPGEVCYRDGRPWLYERVMRGWGHHFSFFLYHKSKTILCSPVTTVPPNSSRGSKAREVRVHLLLLASKVGGWGVTSSTGNGKSSFEPWVLCRLVQDLSWDPSVVSYSELRRMGNQQEKDTDYSSLRIR